MASVTWRVVGGQYKDPETFSGLFEGTAVEYGPFDTYTEAFDVWRAEIWRNVDNAHHRLRIEEVK